MIDHLIFMAVQGAPEIGQAFVKYVAKAMINAFADEAKKQIMSGFSGLAGAFGAAAGDALGRASLDDSSPDLQARVGSVLEQALKEFDLVLIKADELAELRKVAAASAQTPG